MTNQVGVAMENSIITLKRQGWSNRRIALQLSINRKTVDAYVKRHLRFNTGPNPPTGSVVENGPNPPTGSVVENGPNPPTGNSGPPSLCQSHQSRIKEMLELELSVKRIYQDLSGEYGFSGSYDSVKRFIRRLQSSHPYPVRRIEKLPGEEVQIDFGSGAPVLGADGVKRKTWVFRIVLSYSRKAYSESVYHQDTENFIRAMENSFRYFGGVTLTCVPDNLKAAVTKPDFYDPEIVPKLREFGAYYDTVMMPAKSYRPDHKGKVESSVKYVKSNALKGRLFSSLAEQNNFLLEWERKVADQRIHGTTKEQVKNRFAYERTFLQPLPDTLFPCFEEGIRKVHRDGHVEIAGAYYSAPWEFCRLEVWVRFDLRTVRLFDNNMKQVAIHARVEKGRFCTDGQHIPAAKIAAIERGPDYLMRKIAKVGPNTEAWARTMLKNRPIEGLRVLHGLYSMTGKYPSAELENGCLAALNMEQFRLRELRSMIGRKTQQPEFVFMTEHPLIRPINAYQDIVADVINNHYNEVQQ